MQNAAARGYLRVSIARRVTRHFVIFIFQLLSPSCVPVPFLPYGPSVSGTASRRRIFTGIW